MYHRRRRRLLGFAATFPCVFICALMVAELAQVAYHDYMERKRQGQTLWLSPATLARFFRRRLANADAAKLNMAVDPGACARVRRFGNWGDGGYDVCVDGIDAQRGCVVYSFGVSSDPSFDRAMARLGCRTFSFDHTIGLETGHPIGHGVQVRCGAAALGERPPAGRSGLDGSDVDISFKCLIVNRAMNVQGVTYGFDLSNVSCPIRSVLQPGVDGAGDGGRRKT